MKLFEHRCNRAAARLSLINALSGTLLFILCQVTNHDIIFGLGFAFLFLAFISSLGLLLVIIVSALVLYKQLQEFLIAAILLLLNLPLAALYITILFEQ